MAQFTPSKKTAQDFHNGVEYVSGDGTYTGDMVEAETINNLVESALYTQEQADTAVTTSNSANTTAQNALDLINATIQGQSVPPAVGLHHIQYAGEPTPAAIWAGTTWEIDTAYQGKTIIGSGGTYTLGATGGEATHTHNYDLVAAEQFNDDGIRYSAKQIENNFDLLFKLNLTATESIGTINTNIGTTIVGDILNSNSLPPYAVVNYWKRTA